MAYKEIWLMCPEPGIDDSVATLFEKAGRDVYIFQIEQHKQALQVLKEMNEHGRDALVLIDHELADGYGDKRICSSKILESSIGYGIKTAILSTRERGQISKNLAQLVQKHDIPFVHSETLRNPEEFSQVLNHLYGN